MDAKTRSIIVAAIGRFSGKANWEIADNIKHKIPGVRAAQVAEVRGESNAVPEKATTGAVQNRPRIRSLAEFHRDHDIPQKIRDTINGLRKDGYATEEELRQMCGVPVQNWRRNADLPEFSGNKFKLDGVTFWAAPTTIQSMKQITGRA